MSAGDMKPFAAEWPPHVKKQLQQAARQATAGPYPPQSTMPASVSWSAASNGWLWATESYLQAPSGDTNIKQQALTDDQQYEIAHELVLIAMTLLPPAKDKSKAIQASYSAIHRQMTISTLASLSIDRRMLAKVEDSIARQLAQQAQATAENAENAQQDSTLSKMASASTSALGAAAAKSKYFKMAATGVGFGIGAIALGVTGGLAAPMLIASTGGFLSFLGGSSLVLGGLFGLAGGGLAAHRVRKRVEGVEVGISNAQVCSDRSQLKQSFEFAKLATPAGDSPALVATIVCSGILLEEKGYEDLFKPYFDEQGTLQEVYAVKCDVGDYLALGKSIQSWARDVVVKKGMSEVIKRTALGAVMSAVALPATVWSSATSLFDGAWVQRLEKSKKAGELLADTLLQQVQGDRPVHLIGVSLGAVIVFHALLSLQERSPDAARIVHSVTLVGLPLAPSEAQWKRATSVCCTDIVNAYSSNDWVLAVLARAAIHSSMNIAKPPAGISAVKQPFVKDVDLTGLVDGHLAYGKGDVIKNCLQHLADGRDAKIEDSVVYQDIKSDSKK